MGYIDYKKLVHCLAERGLTARKVRMDNIIGQATWYAIQKGRSGKGQHIDTRTIAALCEALECQPGDILTYVPDAAEGGGGSDG